jgi:hypothetical protein
MATGTPGAVRIAGTNEAVVNNLQFGLNASPININLFNGQFSNITGRSASGGVLNVTTGGGSQISNMDIDGLLSITTAGAVLSNVNVRNAGVLAWTSPIPGGVDASNCRFNHEGMTISGAQNKFVNCDFTSTGAGTITLDVTTDANIFDNCTFAAGVPALLTLAGPNTVFSNCVIGLSLIGLGTATGCKMDTCRNSGVFITTFLGADAQVSNCNFGTSLTFAGSNSKATGCIIGGGGSIIMTAGASSGIQIANCQIDAGLAINGSDHSISNCDVGTDLQLAVGSSNCSVLGTHVVTGPLYLGGTGNVVSGCNCDGELRLYDSTPTAGATNPILSNCRVQGALDFATGALVPSNAVISGCQFEDAALVTLFSDSATPIGHRITGCTFAGGLTFDSAALLNNISNCRFGATLTIDGNNNVVDNCQVSSGGFVIDGSENQLSNCNGGNLAATLTTLATGDDHQIINVDLSSTAPGLASADTRYVNLRVAGTTSLSGADCQFTNCSFSGELTTTAAAARSMFTGCTLNAGGTDSIDHNAPDCQFSNCVFVSTAGIVSATATRATFTGCFFNDTPSITWTGVLVGDDRTLLTGCRHTDGLSYNGGLFNGSIHPNSMSNVI